jgi:hypothetical protein
LNQDAVPQDMARLNLGDPRLHHVFMMRPLRCAAVEDYARAAGLEPLEVLEHLGPALEAGIISLESVQDTIFVDTAPAGRPNPLGGPQLPAGLWETLKARSSPNRAQALWRLTRGLESGGWEVSHDIEALTAGLGPLPVLPWLGVIVNAEPVILVPYPDAVALTATQGPLSTLADAGADSVAVTCHNGALEEVVTAVRSWGLGRQRRKRVRVYILEAPRFSPTALEVTDRGIHPVSISRESD